MSRTMLQRGLVLLAALCLVRVADAATPNSIPSTNALSFMRRFGYLEQGRPDSETLYTEEAVVEAIKLVQRFGAIEETGVLDEPTQKLMTARCLVGPWLFSLQLMTARRCGCPDVPRKAGHSAPHSAPLGLGPAWSDRRRKRKKRFVLASSGWKKRHLKYYIANWTPKIGEDAVNDQMVRAFDAWSAYGRLRFSRVLQPGDADITVAFGRGNHGDWFPFDGPGGVLAHAFYPYEMASYGGDIHFDDDEQWAANPNSTEVSMGAVDLFLVAVHELGHSLGLGHSPDPHSIMFPYYQSKSDSFQLGQDDILAMYELYIKRQLDGDNETPDISFGGEERPERPTTSRPTRKPSTTTRRPRPRPTTTTMTPRPRRPTTTTTARPHHHHTSPPPPQRPTGTPTFVGDDETVDEHKKHDDKHRIPAPVPPDGGDKGSSSSSAERENEVPDLCAGSYDAVAQLRGELFVFKGQYLWRLRRPGAVMQGYPVPLRRMFTNLPEYVTSLDAVYQREDGNIVLFSGPRYWVYNGVDFIENSPQPITNYRLPSSIERIDAVMVWAKNKATYFFRNSEFWRYNTTTMDMDRGYPKQIARSWKGIPDKIDDAMTWTDDITYFFKDKTSYKIDNRDVTAHTREEAPQIWFACP